MAAGLTIDTRQGQGKTLVSIAGVVDEHADLSALVPLTGRIEINLRGVRRFNSVGVRVWVDAMRGLGQRGQVVFVECSTSVINQLNMITGFLGRGRVASFVAAMRCEACDADVDYLFDRVECDDGLPVAPCPRCARAMDLDDDEAQYLLFLREPTRNP